MSEKIAPIIETEQDIRAEAYLDTVEYYQWPRGVFYPNAYVLYTSYGLAKPGKHLLTSKQEEQGEALARKLKARMLVALHEAGWQEVSKTKSGFPIWQHRPAGAPAQPARAEAEQPGDQSRQSRTRTVYTRAVTFTCQWCHQEVTEERFPSHTPLYCSKPACKKEATRVKTRERVAAWRKLHPDARKKKA